MPRQLSQVATCAATLALIVVGLTACLPQTGSEHYKGTENANARVTPNETATDPLLPTPLQAYRLMPRELATINHARGVLIDQCMRSAGFSYPQWALTQEIELILAGERTAIGRRYGITDPKMATTYGYGFPERTTPEVPRSVARTAQYLEALRGSESPPLGSLDQTSPEYRVTSDGGCVSEAERALGISNPDISPFGLAHNLWVEGQQRLYKTIQYRSTVEDWVTCMTERGHQVSDPITDKRDIAEVFRAREVAGDPALTGRPTQAEVSLATSDIQCKKKVRLVERFDAISSAIDRRSIAVHKAALVRDRQRLEQALSIAADLLERHEP